MSFDEVRLPTAIERDALGGPNFRTSITTTVGGFEKRNADWDLPRYSYNIGYGIRRKEDMDAVIAFFYARQGRMRGFRFKDWSDYQFRSVATNPSGNFQTFQAVKRYTSGVTFIRPLKKLVTGTVNVYRNGLLVSDTQYNVSHISGVVTFVSAQAPSAVIEIEGEFDVPVRFDTDYLAINVEWADGMSVPDLTLLELRL